MYKYVKKYMNLNQVIYHIIVYKSEFYLFLVNNLNSKIKNNHGLCKNVIFHFEMNIVFVTSV